MSDARLTDCPECNKPTLNKMVTAAGFQLKGSGWYATDFRSGGSNTVEALKKSESKQSDTSIKAAGGKAESGAVAAEPAKSESKAAGASDSAAATPAATSPVKSSTPAAPSNS